MREWRRFVGVCVAAGVLGIGATPAAQRLADLPTRMNLLVGERRALSLGLPGDVYVHTDAAAVHVDGHEAVRAWWPVPGARVEVEPVRVGHFHLQFRLLGLIPLRDVTIDALPDVHVVPGGQAIGVQLNSGGAVVVGETGFRTSGGRRVSPATAAGLQIGDLIVRADDRPVTGRGAMRQLVQQAGRSGRPLHLLVRRGTHSLDVNVKPAFAPSRHRFLLGAWVREGATGIGTLTFYDPQRGVFGALGHVIAESGTGRAFPVDDGHIVPAFVSGLQKGHQGDPGEKLGMFVNDASPWGRIASNTPVGIFGALLSRPSGGLFDHPIPIAAEDQVHVGPAEVLTVLFGQRVQAFGIDIERVIPQSRPASKGLVLHVTDPALLAATGGIVQGMSGSPIIQNGRLVGAVTHVFVHDPTRGYGVLAVWMAEEAGLYRDTGPTARGAA